MVQHWMLELNCQKWFTDKKSIRLTQISCALDTSDDVTYISMCAVMKNINGKQAAPHYCNNLCSHRLFVSSHVVCVWTCWLFKSSCAKFQCSFWSCSSNAVQLSVSFERMYTLYNYIELREVGKPHFIRTVIDCVILCRPANASNLDKWKPLCCANISIKVSNDWFKTKNKKSDATRHKIAPMRNVIALWLSHFFLRECCSSIQGASFKMTFAS